MAEASRRRMRVSFVQVGLCSIILLGAIVGVFLLLGDPLQRTAFSDVISPVVELLASASLLIAARQSTVRSKRLAFAWGTIAAAMLMYAIGDAIWAILELILKESPFPSIADGLYLAYYPLFLAGVVLLINRPASTSQVLNNALDLGMILAAAILGFWNFLIGPMIESNVAAPPLEQAILLAYPVGDLVLLGALLLILYNNLGAERPPSVSEAMPRIPQTAPDVEQPASLISLMATGLTLTIVADCVYSYQSLLGTYVSGGLLDLSWIASSLVFGLAGASQWAGFPPASTAGGYQPGNALRTALEWIKTYLPYFWLLGAFVLLLARGLTPLPMSLFSITMGVGGILSLVVIRQLITIYDNKRLNLELNSTNRNLIVEVGERVRMQAQLAFDVLHDEMTGLANRLLFQDRLGQAIEHSKRHREETFAVLFMDLDHFKGVNDTLGHSFGDQLLMAVGKRLKEAVRSSDTVARFGGDEFAILLSGSSDENSARKVAEKIQGVVGLPFRLREREVHISASIGIATNLISYESPDDLLRDADLAMYHAKGLGKARSEMFRIDMRERAFSRHAVEEELRTGLKNREFQLYYQPITSLKSDRIVGLEALLRWVHPTRGLLLPADFLPVAEESGLILPIGDWVLDQACRQLKTWQEQHPYLQNVTVSVNLSNKQFTDPNFVEKVAKALSASGLTGPSLRLEITERVLVGNYLTANHAVAALHDLGVQMQIDDFGTGYSALAYLQEFPIHAIKIDKSFIHRMDTDPKGLGLVRAVVSMGRELGMETIAEGIETAAQLNELKGLSCGFGQGFLLAKPMSAISAEKMLAKLGA